MNKEILAESVGEVVKALRKEKNLSQEQLSIKSNISRNYISELERGIYNVSLYGTFQLSKSFNIDAMKFIELTEAVYSKKMASQTK